MDNIWTIYCIIFSTLIKRLFPVFTCLINFLLSRILVFYNLLNTQCVHVLNKLLIVRCSYIK